NEKLERTRQSRTPRARRTGHHYSGPGNQPRGAVKPGGPPPPRRGTVLHRQLSASSRCKEPLNVSRRASVAESVTEGHPDKMADQSSDAILDAVLKDDPSSRVAVETLITAGQVHIAGEVTTKTYVDIPAIVRKKIL